MSIPQGAMLSIAKSKPGRPSVRAVFDGELISGMVLRIEGNEFEAHGVAELRLSLLHDFVLAVGGNNHGTRRRLVVPIFEEVRSPGNHRRSLAAEWLQ
jgi:hypothetical protein